MSRITSASSRWASLRSAEEVGDLAWTKSPQAVIPISDQPVGGAGAASLQKLGEAIAPYVHKARATYPDAKRVRNTLYHGLAGVVLFCACATDRPAREATTIATANRAEHVSSTSRYAFPPSVRIWVSTPPADPFTQLVTRAEAGSRDLDFYAMRMTFLTSPAFPRSLREHATVVGLRQEMFAAMERDNAQDVLTAALKILQLDYLDLDAQKGRRQACAILDEHACAEQGKYVELGLLESIIHTGDARSCDSGWKVVSVDEEYFVLRMRMVRVQRQRLAPEGSAICDAIDTVDEQTGESRTYYFDIGEMLAAKQALMETQSKLPERP